MSYSKNGFLATGSGGAAAATSYATLVRSSRNVFVDDCASANYPSNIGAGLSSSLIAYDAARNARVFTLSGTSAYYRSPTFAFNSEALIECFLERISSLASGAFHVTLFRASDAVNLGSISFQSDGNIVIYATSAVGSQSTTGTTDTQGGRYKVSLAFHGSSVDAIVRKGAFTDNGGALALSQTGYASTSIPNGTNVYFQIHGDSSVQFALYGCRVFNGPPTFEADFVSGSSLPGLTVPALSRPQGTLQRRYTFDSDIQNFTVGYTAANTGSISQSNGKLVVVAPSANSSSIVQEPSSAGAVADGEVYIDFQCSTVPATYTFGVLFRIVDTSNFYLGYFDGSKFMIYKRVANTFTAIATGLTLAANSKSVNRLMARFVGDRLSLYCNETLVAEANDTSFTTGRVGCYFDPAETVQVDNVSVYSLASTWTPANYDQPAISGLQAWQPLTLLNGWTNANQGAGQNAPVSYYLGPDGIVHIRGAISGGSTPSTVFTLPAGYRPEFKYDFTLPVYNGSQWAGIFWTAEVQPSGIVQISGPNSITNTHIGTLDSISFRAFG